jgi:micrococcal nuclease
MEHDFYTYKANIIDVYDGDTCTAKVDLGFNVDFTIKLRLLGIDTPELRGEERESGLVVRDLVREKILGKDVVIKTSLDKTGKYGRYLAEIYLDEVNLNEWLLENGHAKPYLK